MRKRREFFRPITRRRNAKPTQMRITFHTSENRSSIVKPEGPLNLGFDRIERSGVRLFNHQLKFMGELKGVVNFQTDVSTSSWLSEQIRELWIECALL